MAWKTRREKKGRILAMRIKSCCFTGHRPELLPWENDEGDLRCAALKSKVRCAVEGLIVERGCTKFITGMARGADMICAEVVLALQMIYPQIRLECAVPSRAFTARWSDGDARKYSSILTRADSTHFISDAQFYSKRLLMLRNIYMVDNSEVVIAVYKSGETGGTKNTISYAESKGREIIIIPPG